MALGLWALNQIPIDAFPDLTNNQVTVVTEAPGLAPAEVEQLVTFPIESAVMGLPRTEQVRSISKLGLSIVTVVFDDSVDVYFARQLLNDGDGRSACHRQDECIRYNTMKNTAYKIMKDHYSFISLRLAVTDHKYSLLLVVICSFLGPRSSVHYALLHPAKVEYRHKCLLLSYECPIAYQQHYHRSI